MQYFKTNPSLSGSALKVLAVLSMLVDHVAVGLCAYDDRFTRTLFILSGEPVTAVTLMRTFGRLAFPIFCFLLVEGYLHTRNRARYALYLLLFAVLSELPFDLVFHGCWSLQSQNVFFTLLFGYLAIWIPPLWGVDRFNRALSLLMITAAAFICRPDYGLGGYIFILGMYHLRRRLLAKMAVGALVLPNGELLAVKALAVMATILPIGLYNGQRGFITGHWLKYAFYAFYPVHLTVIALLHRWLQTG